MSTPTKTQVNLEGLESAVDMACAKIDELRSLLGQSEQHVEDLEKSLLDSQAENTRLREACKKALTCGLDSSVREIVVAALAEGKGEGR